MIIVHRDECRKNILKFLAHKGAPATADELMTIFITTYNMRKTHHAPIERMSNFLGRMESEGLIICEYTQSGFVSTARPKDE